MQHTSDLSAENKNLKSLPVLVNHIDPPKADQLKELTVFKDAITDQSTPWADMEEAYFSVKILLELLGKITRKE